MLIFNVRIPIVGFSFNNCQLSDHCGKKTVQVTFEQGVPIVGLDCVLYLLVLVVDECIVIYKILQFGCL